MKHTLNKPNERFNPKETKRTLDNKTKYALDNETCPKHPK